jgi:hypothetical protein
MEKTCMLMPVDDNTIGISIGLHANNSISSHSRQGKGKEGFREATEEKFRRGGFTDVMLGRSQ